MVYYTILGANSQALALVFDIFFEDFFADIANTADKVAIGPEGAFFPETFLEIGWMQLPNVVGGIAFHQFDDVR